MANESKTAGPAKLGGYTTPYAHETKQTQLEEASKAYISRLRVPSGVTDWIEGALGMAGDHYQIIKPSRMAEDILGKQQRWIPADYPGIRAVGLTCKIKEHFGPLRY